MYRRRSALPHVLRVIATAILLPALGAAPAVAQPVADDGFVPVTDAMLQNPSPDDWLMWRRTLNGWGYSPLDRKVISGRSCRPRAGPVSCVILAHAATTGVELWRTRLVPAPGEPGDETWGGVPYAERMHVGSWMVPSYDPELNLVYVGTSVTSPAPKFMLGGIENRHLYHNSTLALDGDIGEIRWYYQHLNDHWDLDHPYERLLVDTAVTPDASAVAWINPRLRPGDR